MNISIKKKPVFKFSPVELQVLFESPFLDNKMYNVNTWILRIYRRLGNSSKKSCLAAILFHPMCTFSENTRLAILSWKLLIWGYQDRCLISSFVNLYMISRKMSKLKPIRVSFALTQCPIRSQEIAYSQWDNSH